MRSTPRLDVAPTRRAGWLIGGVAAAVIAACAVAPAFAGTGSGSADAVDRPTVSEPRPATEAAAQKLRWTADNSTTAYKSAPNKAVAGPATIEFENSKATGNTSGMQHTLTFDTTAQGYNHDVDLELIASPSDDKNGKWTAEVTLTKGTYRVHCNIPGHSTMVTELKVTGGGGDPGDDTTAPKASAKLKGDKNGNGDFVGSATASITATDEGSGVKLVEYQVDDLGWKTYSDPVKVTKTGDHTIGYRATDKAGNKSQEGTKPFSIVKSDGGGGKDTKAPKVDIMLHGDRNDAGVFLGSAKVMLMATDDKSGVKTVQYKLDGGDWKKYGKEFKVKKVGKHTVRYRATDKAGNRSKVSKKSFKVKKGSGSSDSTAPEVSAEVRGEQNASWEYVGKANVAISASDADSGVAKTEYQVDGGGWNAYDKPVEVADAGKHTVKYRATDKAGNSADDSAVFKIVTEPSPQECTTPDPSPTVVVGDVGTGVRNRDAGDGCTIDDRIRDEARWVDHQAFVDATTSVLDDLVADNVVTGPERTTILDAAKASEVGEN